MWRSTLGARDGDPRFCRQHCDMQPGLVQLHNRKNGVLWPWDFLSTLWNSPGHVDFFEWVHDPKDQASMRCSEYWDRVSHLPFFAELNLENPAMTIPLSWHVDGVKVYKTHKAWCYSHASALKKGPSINSKSLFLLFRDGDMIKPFTHDAVAKLISYAMDVLQSGRYPEKDEQGKRFPDGSVQAEKSGAYFAGGWSAAFACFKGDLEARVMVHKLVRSWNSDSICERCLASKLPQFSYANFSDNAPYMDCLLDHDQIVLLNPPGKTSEWIHVKGWDYSRNLDEPWLG